MNYEQWLEKFKKDHKTVNKMIEVYSIFSNKNSIRNFEKDLLNYYIRFGISLATRRKFSREKKVSMDAVTQRAFYLRDKKYIIKKKKNSKGDSLPKSFRVGDDKFITLFNQVSTYECVINNNCD